MSATTPTKPHTLPGLPYPLAVELAKQIDSASPKAEALVALGMAPPTAVELVRQITAKSGHIGRLRAGSFGSQLSNAIVAAIAVP